MFLGLKDFDIDIFLRLDDENIYLYYEDMETIPQISNYLPLGSFDDEGKLKFKTLDMKDRIKIGMEFLHRDSFAEYEELSMRSLIRVDKFMEQFSNIPEVEEFFDKYIAKCETDNPPEWCSLCKESNQVKKECPEYYDPEFDTCAIKVPYEEFLGIKGEPVLRYDIDIPTEIFIDSQQKRVEASIQIKDSDGTLYKATDYEPYTVLNNTPGPGNQSFLTIEPIQITSKHRPLFEGNFNKINSPLTLTITKTDGGFDKNYQIIINDINPAVQDWEFQLPSTDFLNDGKYIATLKGTKKNTLNDILEISTIFEVITPKIFINPIGVVNNKRPVFSGYVKGINTELTLDIDGTIYRNIPVINNFWKFEMPVDLADGIHVLQVMGNWEFNNNDSGNMQATQNFAINTSSILDLYPPSAGVINEYEYHQDLILEGEVNGIQDGNHIHIKFFKWDFEVEIINSRFDLIIPREKVEKLVDGTHYIIEATYHDTQGNTIRDIEVVLVDLQRPIPSINLEPIPDIDPNTQSVRITGLVSGDAKAGDYVTITVGSHNYQALVYKDTKYPTGQYNLEIDYSDLYYIMILYFNGIYRTNPDYAQSFGTYNILTDINFDLNYYSLIIDIKEFFTREFIYFLKSLPGSIPFANDYGTEIKLAVQTKNYIVQRLEIEAEINFFIRNFNSLYGDLVQIKEIIIKNQESDIGADTWLIEVFASIQQERLIYRLEV